MAKESSSLHYINYLALDKILEAQYPLSGNEKSAAHEEMLFIIIHQTYELWFKQILHELESAMDLFKQEKIDEDNVGVIVGRLDRVNKIMKLSYCLELYFPVHCHPWSYYIIVLFIAPFDNVAKTFCKTFSSSITHLLPHYSRVIGASIQLHMLGLP